MTLKDNKSQPWLVSGYALLILFLHFLTFTVVSIEMVSQAMETVAK